MNSKLFLNSGWKIKDFCYPTDENKLVSELNIDEMWIDADVPGDIHNDLLKSGKIEDPYFSDNSKKCGWVTEKDWCYYNKFRVGKDFIKEKTTLVFEGIDTYGSVWLNGVKLGETDNMFREFSFDVDGLIKENEDNDIVVIVKSIRNEVEKYPYQDYIGCFNVSRIFARKAQCHFGWDWAPDLPGVGIWNRVSIVSTPEEQIKSVAIRTDLDGSVSFFVDVNFSRFISKDGVEVLRDTDEEIVVSIYDNDIEIEKQVLVTGEKNALSLKVDNPKLWWPRGYGEPNLYNYSVRLVKNGLELDCKDGKLGIRKVELCQKPLKDDGFGFRFIINNVPVYCKGANWVPAECFTGTIKDEKYKSLIRYAKEGNFNMLRVWGGGIYEKDIFYNLCDENGLMVWQDFMFACADIPDNHQWFVDKIIDEAEYQVKRLRNHPSIIYWCGGNEKTGAFGRKVFYGDITAHYILRGVCGELDPTRPYVSSSPFSYTESGNDQSSGETHASCLEPSVEKGAWNFRNELNKIETSFNSESAIQGPARYQSMVKFIPEDKLWPINEIWDLHFVDNPYSSIKKTFAHWQESIAADLFGSSDNVKDFIKKAMTSHAEILRAEIEHHRCRINSGGFMFWMFSDIWPTGTWAVIDYYMLPKPAYYAVRRAYEPLIVSIQQKNEGTKILFSNHLLRAVDGNVTYGQATVNGTILWKKEIDNLSIEANSPQEVADFNYIDEPNSYLFAEFEGAGVSASTSFFQNLWKDVEWCEPELSYSVAQQYSDSKYFTKVIKITSAKYARMVNINLPEDKHAYFSDNFFDIMPNQSKVVTITSKEDYDCGDLIINNWLSEWN